MGRACAVVPAYNEATVIAQVLADLFTVVPLVVVVDDGSTDGTAEIAAAAGARVVTHPVNLGQGAALETGIRLGLMRDDVDVFVTFDADGQHRIQDVVAMLAVLAEGNVDVVLGSRFLQPEHGSAGGESVPRARRLLLRLATMVNNALSGTRLTDAHNGLRVFNRRFAELIRLNMLDMAHASELTRILASSGLRYQEVPVVVEYTDYSRAKGQRAVNAINILFDLFLSARGKITK